MSYKILSINPGSTSTKIAIYENELEVFCKTLSHPAEELEKYNNVAEQFNMRKEVILSFLEENGYNVNELAAVVGRGGMVPKVKSGAYIVNDKMINRLKNNPIMEHASNLGALIAHEIAAEFNIPAYIYDSVRVDELSDIARISGMPDIPRTSSSHVLNSRATAMKVAKKYNKKYTDMNFIVAHLGGGISLSIHEKGQIVDIISDDEGPFSPERAGRVPCRDLIDACYSGKFNRDTMKKKLRGNGGLKAYLNTVDAREVEKMIESGDEKAKLVYEAMAYQIAKGIGELATVVKGKVDAIIITGGIAYSKMMTTLIKDRVEFISPVEIMPGENEMEALALGTLRVLKGEENAREYEGD
ncbi:butyrate kinase [Clostridium magnum]|uniref:Probable butyrate kinase n=1 Tax=Clostridium magnum DSM 2767 TaxID=1121326 RepID=A0A162S8D3_9CLOT|nr:butyrate kinase [Clostridium magnum]KZL90904.1 butyrate kinase 2 [Clostridium magnum DSM 2767]SHI12822.1 butyrate kinase [Clostridium magnum DSM 2767]